MVDVNDMFDVVGQQLAKIGKNFVVDVHWPFTTTEFGKNFGDQVMADLKTAMDNYNGKLINPSAMAQFLIYFHSGKEISKEEKKVFLDKMIEVIGNKRENPFCKNNINKLKDVKLKELEGEFVKVKEVSQILALLYSYSEILYPTTMRFCHEFHGPYLDNLFVQDFFDLKPEFTKIANKFPYSNVKIISKVKNSPQIDFFGHLCDDPGHLESRLIIDGKEITDYSKVVNELMLTIKQIYVDTKEYKKEDWLNHLYVGTVYTLNKISKQLITPNKELMTKISLGVKPFDITPYEKFNKSKTEEELKKIVTNSFKSIFM